MSDSFVGKLNDKNKLKFSVRVRVVPDIQPLASAKKEVLTLPYFHLDLLNASYF